MPLAPSQPTVQKARENGYALAAVDSNGGGYGIMRAWLETAEELKASLIIDVYARNACHQGMSRIGPAARHMIDQFAPTVPVAIHLDHPQTPADSAEPAGSSLGPGPSGPGAPLWARAASS